MAVTHERDRKVWDRVVMVSDSVPDDELMEFISVPFSPPPPSKLSSSTSSLPMAFPPVPPLAAGQNMPTESSCRSVGDETLRNEHENPAIKLRLRATTDSVVRRRRGSRCRNREWDRLLSMMVVYCFAFLNCAPCNIVRVFSRSLAVCAATSPPFLGCAACWTCWQFKIQIQFPRLQASHPDLFFVHLVGRRSAAGSAAGTREVQSRVFKPAPVLSAHFNREVPNKSERRACRLSPVPHF